MYNLKQIGRVIFSAVVAVTFSTSTAVASSGSNTGQVSATATATVIQPLELIEAQELRFGKFVAPNDSNGGTVVINPKKLLESQQRSSSSNIDLLSSDFGVGAFTVTGEPNSEYTIEIPDTIITSGGNTITVNQFISNPADEDETDDSGDSFFFVGATLNIPSGQPGGEYSGTYSVTVSYK